MEPGRDSSGCQQIPPLGAVGIVDPPRQTRPSRVRDAEVGGAGSAAGVVAARVDRSAAMTVRLISAKKAGFSGLVSARPPVARAVVPVHHRDASPPGSFSKAVRGGAGKRRTSPHRQGHRPRFGFGVDHPTYMPGPATVGSEPRRAPVNGRGSCPVVAMGSTCRVGVGLAVLRAAV